MDINATYVQKVIISHKNIPKDHLLKERENIGTIFDSVMEFNTNYQHWSTRTNSEVWLVKGL